jgi:hypothetical protein
MSSSEPPHILDTPEGEIALLMGLIHARPVGLSKHFQMIRVLRVLDERLGAGRVSNDDVWIKLATMYDLKMLDEDVRKPRRLPCLRSCTDMPASGSRLVGRLSATDSQQQRSQQYSWRTTAT